MASLNFDIDSAAEEEAALLSASITDEQLHALAGTHELSSVRFLQMAVDSKFVPLNCLGDRLPALQQLKLNGSSLPSLRHLGTSLCHIRVLWLCRCGLQDLDNLGALPELQELYLAFNDIRQLSPLVESDRLLVLDLEANLVEFLQLGPSLQELTLRGNPIAEREAFRNEVLAMMPRLLLFDDEPPDCQEGEPALVPDAELVEERTEGERKGELAAEAAFAASLLSQVERDMSEMGKAGIGCSQRGGSYSGAGSSGQPPSPPRTTAALDSSQLRSDLEGEAAVRREEMLVSRGIKYTEVGRIFDVAADGRQMLTSAGGSRTSRGRPSSARPLVNTWTSDGAVGIGALVGARPTSATGSFSRPLSSSSVSSHGGSMLSRPVSVSSVSRPISALASSLSSRSHLSSSGSSRSMSTAGFSHGFSHNLLASPTRPHDELAEDSAASDLTSSTDIICGVHKLRAHKLRRDVQSMGMLSSGSSGEGGDEPNGLDEELMDQLRAVKIQQLLAGYDLREASDDAPDSDSDGAEEATLRVGREMRLLSEEAEAEEAKLGGGRLLLAGGVAHTYERRPLGTANALGRSCRNRPYKDVATTTTPAGAERT